MGGIRASLIDVKELKKRNVEDNVNDETEAEDVEVEIDFRLCDERQLRGGHYHIVFAHPETLVSSKYGRELLLSDIYQQNVVAIVVDEAHCIVEWLVAITFILILL